jgi:hypothetical protein
VGVSAAAAGGCIAAWSARSERVEGDVRGRAILGITISHFASGLGVRGALALGLGLVSGVGMMATAVATGSGGADTCTGSSTCSFAGGGAAGGAGAGTCNAGRSTTSKVRALGAGAGTVAGLVRGGVAVRYDQVTGKRNVAPYSNPASNVTDFSTSCCYLSM